MAPKKKIRRITREATPEEQKRHAEIREAVMKEFPPSEVHRNRSYPGLPAAIRRARELQGLSWYAVAQKVGIPNPSTVRDIEEGRDARISNVQAVVRALGLRLELVADREQ